MCVGVNACGVQPVSEYDCLRVDSFVGHRGLSLKNHLCLLAVWQAKYRQQDSALWLSLNLLCHSAKEVKNWKNMWALPPAIMLFFTDPVVYSAGHPWTRNFRPQRPPPVLVKSPDLPWSAELVNWFSFRWRKHWNQEVNTTVHSSISPVISRNNWNYPW